MNTVKIVYDVQEEVAKYVETSSKGLALLLYPQIKTEHFLMVKLLNY